MENQTNNKALNIDEVKLQSVQFSSRFVSIEETEDMADFITCEVNMAGMRTPVLDLRSYINHLVQERLSNYVSDILIKD